MASGTQSWLASSLLCPLFPLSLIPLFPASSGLGRASKVGGAFYGVDHGLRPYAGVEQQVVEAAGAPLLLVGLADDGGAALVSCGQDLVGAVGLVREGPDEP